MEVLNRACSGSEAPNSGSQPTIAAPEAPAEVVSTDDLVNEITSLKRQYMTAVSEKEKLSDAVKDLDCRLLAAEKAKRTLESLLEDETRKSAAIRAREVSSSPAAFESKSSRHLAQENDSLKALGVQRDKQIAELRKQLEAGSQCVVEQITLLLWIQCAHVVTKQEHFQDQRSAGRNRAPSRKILPSRTDAGED
jgi:hypothetical protein